MAREWRDVSLGEVIELKRGYDLPQKDRSPGAVPLVSSSGVTDHHTVAMAKGPGVVTGRYGTLGQVFYIPEDFWPLNTTLYVRDFKGNDPRFVSYFLSCLDFLAYSDKAAVPGLNRNHLHQARVRLPADLDEQRAIAHILGTLDDKIELNRRMNETLEAMARALFKSWFVDFDPVRAKAEGRDPGLPKPLADLFPNSFEDSELGEIPKGWKVGRLDQISSIFMGLSPDGDSYNDQKLGIPLINGPVEFGGYFPVKTKWTTSPTRLCQAGDLILCVRGSTTGRRVVADDEYCLGRGVCAMRAANQARTFLYQTVDIALDRLLSKTTGSVFPSLSSPDIKSLPVVIPATTVLSSFETIAKQLTARREASEKASRTLANLRDALLPMLISGELRVACRDALTEAIQ